MPEDLPIGNEIPDDSEFDHESTPVETSSRSFEDPVESVRQAVAEGVVPSPEPADEESGIDLAATAVAGTPVSGGDNPVLAAYAKDVHDTIVELRRLEADIRTLLGDRDPKRKRKFSGTHRWHELEDDVLSLRFSGRIDEDVLRRVQEMISRRHYFFRHLRYLSSTRPVWNS